MFEFDLEAVLNKLSIRRPVFVSEADFQLELAVAIKADYPEIDIRLEYAPRFRPSMHIDILLRADSRWIPIELKYKTKGCTKTVDGEYFLLKNHGAKDVNCYAYLKDIQRIEEIRDNVSEFQEGYTVFLTNDLTYTKKPTRSNVFYKEFCINEGNVKTGRMKWDAKASDGTRKGNEEDIVLQGYYPIFWKTYSEIDDENTGRFVYTINKIEGK